MAVSRGKADDGPTITMRLERDHLVPVSAYDLELLGRWREGAVLNVDPVLAEVRTMEKRYFAMLTRLLKAAETPWSNVPAAHEAIKTAAGFVDPYKKKNGVWGYHPRSITTFTDRELNEFFEIFCGIVRERFGIDPETLHKEAADTGTESSGAPSNGAVDDGPGAGPIPVGVGVPDSPSSAGPLADGPEAGGEVDSPRAASSAEGPHQAAKLTNSEWLKQAARMLVSATAQGGGVQEAKIIDRQVQAIKQNLTPRSISPNAKSIAQSIYRLCLDSCLNNEPLDKQSIADMAGCTVDDLRPEAR